VNIYLSMWQNRGSVVRALSRAPMLWTSASHAGFTKASSPWLPVHPSYRTANVEVMYVTTRDDDLCLKLPV